MTFSTQVTSVTREAIVPKVYDTITKGSPLLMFLLQNAKPWKSGYRYDVPIKYAKSTKGGVVGISDKLDTERSTTRTKMQFEPKMITKPVVIADIEETLNQGDEAVLDLLATEFDSIAQDLIVDLAAELYAGTGTGDRWDSLANAADDATVYSTYGSLSRSTFTSLKGYYLASAGALTLAKLATAFDAVEIGTDKPTLIATTKAIWSTYESLLTPMVRAGYSQQGYPQMTRSGVVPSTAALKGSQGFDAVWYRGTPIVKDEQCLSGKLFLINTNAFGFKGVNLKGYQTLNFKKTGDNGVPIGAVGSMPSTRGFNFTGMMHPTDQLAKVGHIVYAGNFISENPRLQGQLTGAS